MAWEGRGRIGESLKGEQLRLRAAPHRSEESSFVSRLLEPGLALAQRVRLCDEDNHLELALCFPSRP